MQRFAMHAHPGMDGLISFIRNSGSNGNNIENLANQYMGTPIFWERLVNTTPLVKSIKDDFLEFMGLPRGTQPPLPNYTFTAGNLPVAHPRISSSQVIYGRFRFYLAMAQYQYDEDKEALHQTLFTNLDTLDCQSLLTYLRNLKERYLEKSHVPSGEERKHLMQLAKQWLPYYPIPIALEFSNTFLCCGSACPESEVSSACFTYALAYLFLARNFFTDQWSDYNAIAYHNFYGETGLADSFGLDSNNPEFIYGAFLQEIQYCLNKVDTNWQWAEAEAQTIRRELQAQLESLEPTEGHGASSPQQCS